MYSIPQQAVTKGYWKIEYFRAQPMASSSRLVKNPTSPDISLPIQGAIVPSVEEPYHEDPQKDDHLCQAPCAEPTINNRTRVEEDEFYVEQDEENSSQVELDRQAADWQREGDLSAL